MLASVLDQDSCPHVVSCSAHVCTPILITGQVLGSGVSESMGILQINGSCQYHISDSRLCLLKFYTFNFYAERIFSFPELYLM